MNSWDIDPNLYRPVLSSRKELNAILINTITEIFKSGKSLAVGKWRGQDREDTKLSQPDYSCRNHHDKQAQVADHCNYPDPLVF